MTRPAFAPREQKHPISSVDRALDILEAFSAEQPEMGLSELALRCGMGKSTVHKLLQTLAARGYVAQDPATRRYRLGLGAWTVGATAVSTLNVRQVALPQLHTLAAETGEQVLLWVLEGVRTVCLERIDSGEHRVRAYTHVGAVEYPEATSAGRCLLAFADPNLVEATLERVAAGGEANAGPALRRRLDWIRSRDYDVNTGDLWHEIRAVSTVIRDRRGAVVASVAISGPASRFDFAARARALAQLLTTGAAISAALGYQTQLGGAGLKTEGGEL